jgi:Subtilase family
MSTGDGKGEDKGKRGETYWNEVSAMPGITGNARWEVFQARDNKRIAPDFVVPVFVRLNLGADRGVADVIAFLNDRKDQYSLSDHEMDSLLTEAEFRREGADVLAVILCSPDAVEADAWTVLHVGPPQARGFRQDGSYFGRAMERQSGPLSCTPVMGIVDDGLAFLHHRFRKADGSTRFAALWIMHSGLLADDPGPFSGASVLFGIELTPADIDGRIASGRSEEALYRQVNNGVFGPVPRKSTSHHAAHGTHVLDLATGAGAAEDMAGVPILGVQLPPSSIGDTSGRRLDPDIALALRWIVTKALQRPERAPLVINLSLGALAGPQDGTGFLETVIAAEIARYHFYSRNAPIRVVIAYGNAWRSRLVARRRLRAGEAVTLDWRVLPDDATPSYLELRTGKTGGGDIAITVAPPAPAPVLALPAFPAPGVVWQYLTPQGPVAEVSLDPEVNFAKTLITLAATVRNGALPAAPSGPWRITLQNTATKPRDISVKVQRDDTPSGYRRQGRQSWLDHPTAWAFESLTMALTMPAPGSPLTRKGSDVSYAGLAHPSVYFVGAARPDPFAPNGHRASVFSAEGGLPPPESPTVSARADAGSALPGVRAAGALTGSTARLSGTSMAAPMVTRRLLMQGLSGTMTAQTNPTAPHDLAELTAVLSAPPLPVADTRLGRGTVVA